MYFQFIFESKHIGPRKLPPIVVTSALERADPLNRPRAAVFVVYFAVRYQTGDLFLGRVILMLAIMTPGPKVLIFGDKISPFPARPCFRGWVKVKCCVL